MSNLLEDKSLMYFQDEISANLSDCHSVCIDNEGLTVCGIDISVHCYNERHTAIYSYNQNECIKCLAELDILESGYNLNFRYIYKECILSSDVIFKRQNTTNKIHRDMQTNRASLNKQYLEKRCEINNYKIYDQTKIEFINKLDHQINQLKTDLKKQYKNDVKSIQFFAQMKIKSIINQVSI